MSKKRKKLLWQLYPSYLIIAIFSLVVIAWYISTAVKEFYFQETAEGLKVRATLFRELLHGTSFLDPMNRIDHLCKKVGHETSTRITVITPEGLVVGDSEGNPWRMENHADRPEIQTAMGGGTGIATRYSSTLDKEMMYVTVPIQRENKVVGVVRASLPVTTVLGTLKVIYREVFIIGGIVTILVAIASLIISYRIKQPLKEIRVGAKRFASGDLDYRLDEMRADEIGSLAETLNLMAVQLDDRIKTITQQRNELKTVLSSMVEGVFAVDSEERIVGINQAAAELLNIDRETSYERNVQEIIRNAELLRFISRTLASEEPIEAEIVLRGERELYLQAHGAKLPNVGENRIGALFVLNDVTRLKRLENIRRDFVANVSHELKTPITSIKGFVETLKDGAINEPENAEKFLNIIDSHSDRLNSIIEDLLNLSRIEQLAEADQVLLEEKKLEEVLNDIITLFKSETSEPNFDIKLNCDSDIMANISPPLFERGILNLLDNAVKYCSDDCFIKIEVERDDREIKINIVDNGIGIPQEHLQRIFERFYRVDKSRSREVGGTGLGLSIVKHITAAHRGWVSVTSIPGKGSTFTIHLPVN